jgi:hypothetical protein
MGAIDIISRVLFVVFLLAAYYLPVAKSGRALFMVMAIVFIYLPEYIQIYVESKENGKLVLGKKQAFSVGFSVLCIVFIIILNIIW